MYLVKKYWVIMCINFFSAKVLSYPETEVCKKCYFIFKYCQIKSKCFHPISCLHGLTLTRMNPGLPGFRLQTADYESRWSRIAIPLLHFLLKILQTQVIFLCWVFGWKCIHRASIFVWWKSCQNQIKLWNLQNLTENIFFVGIRKIWSQTSILFF